MSWTSSPEIQNISASLVKALGELSDVPKGREAKIPTKTGASYGYRYADLADALSMIRPILAKYDLAVTQTASNPDHDTVAITTTLLHGSGQWITFDPLLLPNGRTAQETGSAITYGRRYSLLAVLGLAAEDDDGAGAAPRQPRNAPTRPAERESAPVKKAPVAATPEADEIKRMLAEVTADTAKSIKAEFLKEFGKLADLSIEKQQEARDWVALKIAMADLADAEWIASAKDETEEGQ
jgi:hypothetical protein